MLWGVTGWGKQSQVSQPRPASSAQPGHHKLASKLPWSWIDTQSSQRSFVEGFCGCLLGGSRKRDFEGSGRSARLSQVISAPTSQPNHPSSISSGISAEPLSAAISARPDQPSHISNISSPTPAHSSHPEVVGRAPANTNLIPTCLSHWFVQMLIAAIDITITHRAAY